MRILKVKFGTTHALTNEGDVFKGRQTVTLACAGDLEITPPAQHRFEIKDGVSENVGCPTCLHILNPEQAEGESL